MDKQKQYSGISNLFLRLGDRAPPKQIVDEEAIMREFQLLLMNFKKRMIDLNFKWSRIRKYSDLLANPETQESSLSMIEKGRRIGLLELYHNKWIALRLTSGLYGKLKENIQVFHSSKQDFVAKITELYLELGEKVRLLKESPGQNEVLVLLSPLMKVKNNPQLVESYIITNYYEIMRGIGTIKDIKTANELRHLIVVLSSMEMKEIDKCVRDIKSWPRATTGIPLFIERGFLYIRGGKSRYDNETFLGFNMHFRDEKLVGELRSSPEVRRLMTYQKEIEFFNRMSSAIRESVRTQGKWEGFYDFYNNLDKGENYIGVVRERYGNDRFAKVLEAFKKEKHEAPVQWATELSELSNMLISRAYQLVIEPAGNAFIRIFNAASKRLEKEKQTALSDLNALMTKDDGTAELKRQFITLIKKTRTQLIEELEEERLEFRTLVRSVLLQMPKMNSLFLNALDTSDPTNQTRGMISIFNRYLQWSQFASAHLGLLRQSDDKLENDETVRAITAAIASLQKESILADKGLNLSKEVSERIMLGYSMLAQASGVINTDIGPKLVKCDEHIRLRVGGYNEKLNYFLTGNIQPKFTSKEDLRGN